MKFEKISADEAQSKRAGVTNSAGVMAKGVPISPEITRAAKFDEDARTARFVMSAEVPDRMGDIVVQEGINLDNFNANPQALLFHNSRSWPIGTWKDVEKNLTGRPKRTEGTMQLLPKDADVDADRAARHLAAGTMRTCSIGFRVNWEAVEAIRDDDGNWTGYRFMESELLECSLVPIPALPAAAMKELTTGMLSAETKELIKATIEEFALDDAGQVVRREELAGRVREIEGSKSYILLPKLSAEKAAELKTIMAGYSATLVIDGEKQAGDPTSPPTKPKDGEEVPETPDPTDGEKTKGVDLNHPITALAAPELANEIAKQIREEAEKRGGADGFMTRLLRHVLPIAREVKAAPPAPVKTDEELAAEARAAEERKAADARELEERRAAAVARTKELQEAAEKLVA